MLPAMCGRSRLTQAERFAELSDVRLMWNPRPRYHIAPTQQVAVVLDEEPGVFFPEIRRVRPGR